MLFLLSIYLRANISPFVAKSDNYPDTATLASPYLSHIIRLITLVPLTLQLKKGEIYMAWLGAEKDGRWLIIIIVESCLLVPPCPKLPRR